MKKLSVILLILMIASNCWWYKETGSIKAEIKSHNERINLIAYAGIDLAEAGRITNKRIDSLYVFVLGNTKKATY